MRILSATLLEARPIFTIDRRDRLVEVNRAFVDSLPAMSGEARADAIVGRPIWDFVKGLVPRRLWQVLHGRARALGSPIFVPLRADTITERRLIDVELHPLPDGSIRHVHECVALEHRSAVALLDPHYPRDARELIHCAWCARIQVRLGIWEEVEAAHVSLRLGDSVSLPALREGACAACRHSILQSFPARVA